MVTYDTEAEVREKIGIRTYQDLARDLVVVKADLIFYNEAHLTHELLIGSVIPPVALFDETVEELKTHIVDKVKTKEVADLLIAFEQLKVDAYRCTNWLHHEATMKRLGLAI